MTTPQPAFEVRGSVQADPAILGGVYSNSMFIWHTANDFTLDFLVNSQAPQLAQAHGQNVIEAPRRLVARVRIPPGLIFDVLQTVNENITNYEATFGPIHRPGRDERRAA